jgi:hypothetical protein
MDTKNPRGANARASVSIAADTDSLSANPLKSQPDATRQLQALRLIDRHRVRPELAMTLAALAYGGGRANG